MSLKTFIYAGAVGLSVVICMPGPANAQVWPGAQWETATPASMGMDNTKLEQAKNYAGGAGMITRGGKIVKSWGSLTQKFDIKSTTKSFGATALGVAVMEGKIQLADPVQKYHPSFGTPPDTNTATGWIDKVTILHLATQIGGFKKNGGYTKIVFQPGTQWLYSDGGPNWLAETLTLIYAQDIQEMMFSKVFTPIGITTNDLSWRNNQYRGHTINTRNGSVARREFGAGIHTNVNALARLGYLYLRGGTWNGKHILTQSYIDLARTPVSGIAGVPSHSSEPHKSASNHYGLLWWNNADGTMAGVPRDTYWAWGLHDSLIIVIPSLDIVVARAGDTMSASGGEYKRIEPFILPIVQAATTSVTPTSGVPTPQPTQPSVSTVIQQIVIDANPAFTAAEGSDIWVNTWADDDNIYTSYGDGWGFEPKLSSKLSMGFASISGNPPALSGTNIRSATGEQTGNGGSGKKPSGMIMVDGILYIWVRNANNSSQQSQLAWSADYARTWQWSSWKMAEFGYPAFINFGKNNAGGRDNYVYSISPDSPHAYNETDTAILMRVPKSQIKDQNAYEFWAGGTSWVSYANRAQRKPILTDPGAVNRLDVTYNAPLKTYLMTMRARGQNGGKNHFSIYAAPEPWGPWSRVYHLPISASGFTPWPGESAHIPSKWISADGKTLYLIHSSGDRFNVQKMTIIAGTGSVTPSPCPLKSQGDADCNGTINLADFEQWRKEFMGTATTKQGDFNSDTSVNLIDFEIWRKSYLPAS